MSVPLAFVGIVLIWSTTPLAIQWSGLGSGFLFGVTGRMVISAVLILMLLPLFNQRMPWHRRARRTYLVGGLSLFAAMTSVYWGAQFIPSGWISVIFGLNPVLTGLLAGRLLEEKGLTPTRLLGALLGLAGLFVIFGEGANLAGNAWLGILAVLFATFSHALGGVWIKRIKAGLPGMVATSGSLWVAVPLWLMTWFLTGQTWPEQVPPQAIAAIVYLGVFGSVIGFSLYYYVLREIEAVRLSLVTLITPVLALLLGHWLNDEPLRSGIWLGTALVTAGLLSFEIDKWPLLRFGRKPILDTSD